MHSELPLGNLQQQQDQQQQHEQQQQQEDVEEGQTSSSPRINVRKTLQKGSLS